MAENEVERPEPGPVTSTQQLRRDENPGHVNLEAVVERGRREWLDYLQQGIDELKRIREKPRGEREEEWNKSEASTWFGEYSHRGLRQVQRRLTRTHRRLENATLHIKYSRFGNAGVAIPGAPRMHLSRTAIQRYEPEEVAQLMIHEATYLAVAGWDVRYHWGSSRVLATDTPWKARWNSDNLTFFATSVAGLTQEQVDSTLGK